MRLSSAVKTSLIVVLIVALLAVPLLVSTIDGNALNSSSPIAAIYSDIFTCSQTLTSNSNKSGFYPAFNPIKVISVILKKLYQIAPLISSKSIYTQNYDLPILTLLLFIIFYRLARTSSEKPYAPVYAWEKTTNKREAFIDGNRGHHYWIISVSYHCRNHLFGR